MLFQRNTVTDSEWNTVTVSVARRASLAPGNESGPAFPQAQPTRPLHGSFGVPSGGTLIVVEHERRLNQVGEGGVASVTKEELEQ